MTTTPTYTITQQVKHSHYGIIALIIIILVSFLAGSLYAYTAYKNEKTTLENEIARARALTGTLSVELDAIRAQTGNQSQVVFSNENLTQLYDNESSSVVMIEGFITQGPFYARTTEEVQGSGFVYNYSLTREMVIVTNYHVVDGATDISVTFKNGRAYAAKVLGYDVYSDLAALEVINASADQFVPLKLVNSSSLNVGDPVIAIGNPFGLTGSMTTGSVSQLGRTITENTTGGYAIPDIIQFSAPINPGNSGGPLLNSEGHVVGITTAIVENSQGLGFAIPSNAIIREIAYLINNATYWHPYIGVQGTDMDYYIANAMNTNITYGWLITKVISNSPAAAAGLRGGTPATIEGTSIPIGGDIILAINGTSIINGDALSTYLEEHTQPYNTLNLTIARELNGTTTLMNIPLTLGERPQP